MKILKTKKRMIKIVYLFTTKGCEACNIMENILRKVHKDNLYTFSIEVIDFNDTPTWIKIAVPLHDFPTIVFVENNVIKYHTNGTMTGKKLQSIIQDIHFN